MSNEPAAGEEIDAEVPDAVLEWLSSVAAERGLSESELLNAMFAGDGADRARAVDERALDRLEERFRSMIDDVRERVVQVKRETDAKAPMDHAHRDLTSSLEQLRHELEAIEVDLEEVDHRLVAGFENYEEILTYLTETTDEINQRLGRLASAVIDLREQVGEAVRDEARRTALAHLTQTANRHGVDTAKCSDCGETVDIGLLVEPRCPHCDAAFSSLEPKSSFFRKSVLHAGTPPALESAPVAKKTVDAGLESLVDGAEGAVGEAPAVDRSGAEAAEPTVAAGNGPRADREVATEAATDPHGAPGERTGGTGDLQTIDGIGPAYAERLRGAGIDGLVALAVADAEELGDAIDVPASTVADWIEQADTRTGA